MKNIKNNSGSLSKDELQEIVDLAHIDVQELKKQFDDSVPTNNEDDDSVKENKNAVLNKHKVLTDTASKVHFFTVLKVFAKKNAEALYILLSFFILTEGVALTKFTSYFWLPIVISLALLAITISWKNYKFIIKSAVSFAILLGVSAFQMIFATAYSRNPNIGLLVPAATVCSYFVFICISYMIDTNVSRWNSASIGCMFAFVSSYFFLMGGIIPSAFASMLTLMVLGCIWMLIRNRFSSRASNMPKRSRIIDSYQFRKINDSLSADYDVEAFEKCKYPFYVFLPKNDNESGKVIILLPLEFTTHIVNSLKRGLTYNNRKVGDYFYRVASYCKSRVCSDAVVLFGDFSGILKTYDIVGVEIADSSEKLNIGLINLSNGRRRIRNDIITMINRFIYPAINSNTIQKLKKKGTKLNA